MMRERARAALVAAAVWMALAGGSAAQPGRAGLGFQVGRPAGVTARILLESGTDGQHGFNSLLIHSTLDEGNDFLIQAHVARDILLPESPIGLFAGPGVVIAPAGDDPRIGVGAIAGGRFYKGRFEVHFQAAPRLFLQPDLHAVMGAGVGFRYYP